MNVRCEINRARRPEVARLDVVVPVFDEEDSLAPFLARMDEVAATLPDARLRYVFVNDGSRDGTLEALWSLAQARGDVAVVDLSRNFGKEAALTAGLAASTGDAVVPIDVDLQDPPEVIAAFLDRWREGYDVVVGRRAGRGTDGAAKRLTSFGFYRLFNLVSPTPIPADVGDFRLMDRKVVDAVLSLGESQRFMKGLMSWVGFAVASVDYDRPERAAGGSRFNYRRLGALATEGLISFSALPLKVWFGLGVGLAGISLAYALAIVVRTLVFGIDVPGYASLIVAILFTFSFQLISVGVVAAYVARIHIEVKRRPAYIVANRFGAGAEDEA